MSTLVFLLDHDDLDLLGRQDLIRIAHDDAPEIVRAIEDVVALATGSAGGPVYCGLATLEAVAGPGLVPGELVAQLRKVQLYPNGEPCPPFPFGQRIQWVDQTGDGFGEEQQALFDVPTQHELFDISRLTMRRYHERCALSGIAMPVGELGSIPTAIRPNPPGAPLSITNFIALWPPLGSAFGAGHFTISSSYETIANLDLLDHRLREHLQPGLKLRLPDQEEDWPSQDHLAYHRRFVFKR
ncbi:hypothetical protein XM25_14865 [Devosia sp. H5989]|nr:hypothetical protein XM25_14865 [Devosia sp. H5989]